MLRSAVLLFILSALSGCGVVSGAASVAGTAISVTATAVGTAAETAADVVTAPLQ